MSTTAFEMRRSDLPGPDEDALSHSVKVATRVRHAIQASGGVLPFDRYMDMVLYLSLIHISEPTRRYASGGAGVGV